MRRRIRAELGDRGRTIAALHEAVAKGFRDATRVKEEKAFDKFRRLPEFEAVVAELK